VRVVMERVEAVLRRVRQSGEAGGCGVPGSALRRGRLLMDPERHSCTWAGSTVTLTVKEFSLVWALAREPGVVKTRNALMDVAYGDEVSVGDRTIDSHIKQLREKFGAVDPRFDAIETIRRLGYRFNVS
jgi:two-component system response regulator ChvI